MLGSKGQSWRTQWGQLCSTLFGLICLEYVAGNDTYRLSRRPHGTKPAVSLICDMCKARLHLYRFSLPLFNIKNSKTDQLAYTERIDIVWKTTKRPYVELKCEIYAKLTIWKCWSLSVALSDQFCPSCWFFSPCSYTTRCLPFYGRLFVYIVHTGTSSVTSWFQINVYGTRADVGRSNTCVQSKPTISGAALHCTAGPG